MKKHSYLVFFYCFLSLSFSLTAETTSSKRVLVTGGAGFLGSHLCDRLLQDNCEVICLDNLYTGQMDNIRHLIDHPHFTFIQQDVCQTIELELPLDEIYNLACPASPPHYQFDPVNTVKTNVIGALNVLELARQHRAKVLQASTSEIYGDPLQHPQTESYWGNVNPIGPRACYDEGKRCAETLFFCYHKQYDVRIKVARIFNTYGPRMSPSDGRVVSNFIMQALTNQPITIYGNGQQTRSFCYVEDLIEGFIRLMATSDDVTGPINLGNDGEFTMLELAQKVIRLSDSFSEIVFKPLPQDDPQQRRPNLSLARSKLDWEPEIPLAEGLKRTIAYFSNLIQNPQNLLLEN